MRVERNIKKFCSGQWVRIDNSKPYDQNNPKNNWVKLETEIINSVSCTGEARVIPADVNIIDLIKKNKERAR